MSPMTVAPDVACSDRPRTPVLAAISIKAVRPSRRRTLRARSGVWSAGARGTIASSFCAHGRGTNMTSTPSELRKSTPPSVADDPRWARIVARDKTADGHLWYSVVTTGVYCRPSCASRTANPKNVQLHDSLESAKATGFRPCKRCNPDGLSVDAENAALVAKACRMIEESEEEPSLEELAEAAGRSPELFPSHVQGYHGRHAQGIRRRPARGEGSARAGFRQHGYGSDLRRRLQFERALLRKIDRHAGHDSLTISRGR